MKSDFYILIIFSTILITFSSCNNQKTNNVDFALTYPETKVTDVKDNYFGTEVADPYRWLEDDNSEETAEWVKAQNEVSFKYLESIPYREKIRDRLVKIWDYPKVSAPTEKDGLYFYFRNDGLQNQSVLYYKKGLESEEIELLDPNNFDKEGTVSLSNVCISEDCKYLVYAISRAGSDWREIYVRDIETLKDLDDHLEWVKFSSIAWLNDGFYYTKYPEPEKGQELSGINTNSKIYYHKVGTDQSEDILIYEDPKNPEIGFSAYVTDDEKYLIIHATKSTSGNSLYYKDLEKPNSTFVKLVDDFDNDYTVIHSKDNKLYVYTNYQAPMYKMIEIDVNKPDRKYWKDFIAEDKSVLETVNYIGERFIANYMVDAHSVVKIFDEQGKFLHDLDNKEIGTIYGFSGDKDSDVTFYTFTSFTTPAVIYSYDIKANKSSVYEKANINFNTDDYETKQIFYTSKDGTKVPMFIVHKKGIALDGKNPTLLYGYGGFNISLTPSFSISRCVWLEQGGIVAIPNIRGGGEYGEEWHKAGTLMRKQNVFDDFIAAAEYLISNQYTSPERLAIQGGSNGGLLVGAVANQRPDLFAVALPAVGVMDMLRYHKFTIGRYWATDYGTSEDSKEMFEYLYKYSPLHNIKPDVEYPAVLVTTGDHDDRVVPAHSFKYIATLQATYKGERPVLIRIETQAGHGAGKPTKKIIDEIADTYAFTFYNMGFTPVFQ